MQLLLQKGSKLDKKIPRLLLEVAVRWCGGLPPVGRLEVCPDGRIFVTVYGANDCRCEMSHCEIAGRLILQRLPQCVCGGVGSAICGALHFGDARVFEARRGGH